MTGIGNISYLDLVVCVGGLIALLAFGFWMCSAPRDKSQR